MEFKELLDFIRYENKRLKAASPINDEEKRVFVQLAKVYEELGELSEEILAHHSMQRKEKLIQREEGNLADEFADVIITVLILSDVMGIDIEKSLLKKIDKIKARIY
ncbi:MAG: MazG nucleotide pyrophosphohydrolase domain-containing protein [bacterium]|nr:MazG nucleotide pyrophosphohydrolase domain-containing protein [bacterium]